MLTTDHDGIRTLQALRAVEAAQAAGESVEAAIEREAVAHGLDPALLCARYFVKLDAVETARAALAGESAGRE